MTWQQQLPSTVDAIFESMVELRRHLHQNPELSGAEQNTSQHLLQLLKADHVDARIASQGRGVVADLSANVNGSAGMNGPCIALRADIDALPIQDVKQVPYASQCEGVMHACGHDAHTALVFGAFRTIQSLAEQGLLNCAPRVRAIFQPAEETCTGAKEMIADRAIAGVDAILAVHMDPKRSVGAVGLKSGVLTASCDELIIEILGQGGHAARPHEARDPVLAAAQLMNQLVSHFPRPADGASASANADAVVLTICRVEAGHASNVIPETAKLWGTMRTLEPGVRKRSIDKVMQVAKSVARATNTEINVRVGVAVDSVMNDAELTELFRKTIVFVYGADALETIQQPSMGSEDFAFYGSQIPACMIRLGCASDRIPGGLLHTPQFDIDEEVLRIGARLMAEASIRWLEDQQSQGPPTTEADAS